MVRTLRSGQFFKILQHTQQPAHTMETKCQHHATVMTVAYLHPTTYTHLLNSIMLAGLLLQLCRLPEGRPTGHKLLRKACTPLLCQSSTCHLETQL